MVLEWFWSGFGMILARTHSTQAPIPGDGRIVFLSEGHGLGHNLDRPGRTISVEGSNLEIGTKCTTQTPGPGDARIVFSLKDTGWGPIEVDLAEQSPSRGPIFFR